MSRRLLVLGLVALLAGCQVAEAPTGHGGIFAITAVPVGFSPAPMPTESPETPVSTAPVVSPTPTSTPWSNGHHGGSGGGGAPAPPALVPAEVGLDTGFSARRVAGAAEGGDALGMDALSARFMGISGIVIAPNGTLYVADPVRHEVREIPAAGPTRVVAGLGNGRSGFTGDNVPADATALNTPMGLCREPVSGSLVVADSGNDRIRLFTPDGRIYTLAGGGSQTVATVANPLAAKLAKPWGLGVDGTGRMIFTERTSGRVRAVTPAAGVTTLATLAVDQAGPVAVRWDGQRIWVGEGGQVRLVSGGVLDATPVVSFVGATVTGLAYDQAGTLYVLVTEAGGRKGTKLHRLPVGDDGRMPAGREAEPVAGTGGEDADVNAYAAPTAGDPDAATVLLGGAWVGQLAIDLTNAADPTQLAGQLYLGSSLNDAGVQFGQVVKLTPRE